MRLCCARLASRCCCMLPCCLLPWSAVGQAVVYGTITYALICLEWTAYKFWYYILFTVLTILFFTYYGEMSVAVSPSPQLAAIMSSAIYSVWFIFAGAPQAAMRHKQPCAARRAV